MKNTLKDNIQSTIDYYESEDFINNHAYFLLEDSRNCIDHIQRILRGYDFELEFGEKLELTDEEAKILFDYIAYNMDEFLETFHNCWVGDFCLDSQSFGEQEEDIDSFREKKDGTKYGLNYTKKVLEENNFFCKGAYAYYDLSSKGVYIDLSKFADLEQIKTILKENNLR